jgi:cell division protein FtsB
VPDLRSQDGQIIPGLLLVMLSLLAFGVLFFQVGRAAIFSTEAQTAADAAALAAVKDVRAQLIAQVAETGTSDLALIDESRVRAAAESYAQRNGGHVTRLERRGVDVKVWVSTNARLGRRARDIDQEDMRGNERARARIDVIALAGVGGGASIGSSGGGSVRTIARSDWDKLADEISSPPTCGSGASSNDIVKLGHLLRAHGFAVGENAEMGDNPAPGVHSATGYHYRCRNSAALDVNADAGPGSEKSLIDGIVADVQRLGFRTIWQAAGHYDHIHIDLAASGPIGEGYGSGGAVGALEETTLDVRLIDWDAEYLPFYGLGGIAAGGLYSGPPDPAVARVICATLDRYHASPKVRLSAFEAAIVESGVHNLRYGDRDSLGVFQQRPSVGAWGTAEQILDPAHAAMKYVTTAIAKERSWYSPGQLAQAVQVSAFPARYDQVQMQASALMERYC